MIYRNKALRLTIVLTVLLCVGCEKTFEKRYMEAWPRQEVCYDGVVYIDRYRHLTVKFLPDGSVATTTKLGAKCDT